MRRSRSLILLGSLSLLTLLASALMRHAHVTAIPLLESGGPTWVRDEFRADANFADAAEIPAGAEVRGSRVDGPEHRGTLLSAWFRAVPRVSLLVAGFPRKEGNRLELEVRGADGTAVAMPFAQATPGNCWRPWTVELPPGADAFRIHAIDNSVDEDGWFSVSAPFRPSLHPALLPLSERALLAFLLQALLFLAVGAAVTEAFRGWRDLEPALVPLVAAAGVAGLGYVILALCFAAPLAGAVGAWTVCGASALMVLWRWWKNNPTDHGLIAPVVLTLIVGAFYITLLQVAEPGRFSDAAANRFLEGLPSDNEIPRVLAERLWKGESLHHLWGDWLSSDRPPLQSGWVLLTWPVLRGLGFDLDTASATAGMCFQLLWVPAVWALAQHLGATRRQALAVAAALSCSGVFLIFTVFVWPKLSAAALVVAAYLLWFASKNPPTPRRWAVGGACAALAWLTHGGVAFSLLGLVPLVVWQWRRQAATRARLIAAAVFLVCAAPWFAYQRWYDPPGNRLVKWHLGGAEAIDARGAGETILAGYAEAGLTRVLQNKWANLRMQFGYHWTNLPSQPGERRLLQVSEFYYTTRGWHLWLFALAAPLMWLRRGVPPSVPRTALIATATWLVAGVAVWLVLMFQPMAASIHQGTLVTQLLSFTLLAMLALHFDRRWFLVLATLQAIWFAALWGPVSSRTIDGPIQPLFVVLASILGLALLVWMWRLARPPAAAERAGS